MDNHFVCKGKLAGSSNRRATPGGIMLEDIVLAVTTKNPWKQSKVQHLKLTCFGDSVDVIKKTKTGDILVAEGFMEQKGNGEEKEIKLIVTKLEKEK